MINLVQSVLQNWANAGLILSSSKLLSLPQLPQKNGAYFKSHEMLLKNNHPVSLI
jgi:hypothetical protein